MILKHNIHRAEEQISDLLHVQGFFIADDGPIFSLKFFRLDLQCVRIDLPLPKPLSAPELDILRVDRRQPRQISKERSPCIALLYAQRKVGDPVFEALDDRRFGQRRDVPIVRHAVVQKVSIATLQRETMRQPRETLNDFHDWWIDLLEIELPQGLTSLLRIVRVLDEFLWFRECFQRLPVLHVYCADLPAIVLIAFSRALLNSSARFIIKK